MSNEEDTTGADQGTTPVNNTNRNNRNKKNVYKFKGSTVALNGHVFLTPAESRDPKLFKRTLEEIKRYADITFTTGAADLAPLFSEDLKEPSIIKPKPLPEKLKKDEVELKF